MSWFHSGAAAVDARNHASPAEVVACFQDQRNALGRLAFLITGDQATAEQAVVQACEMTLRRNSPFRDWLFEWAKAATIAGAISQATEAIRQCEAKYKDRRCPHAEHLLQGDAGEVDGLRIGGQCDVETAADQRRWPLNIRFLGTVADDANRHAGSRDRAVGDAMKVGDVDADAIGRHLLHRGPVDLVAECDGRWIDYLRGGKRTKIPR